MDIVLGMPRKFGGITSQTALRAWLARLLNASPDFCMNVQTATERYQAASELARGRWPPKERVREP